MRKLAIWRSKRKAAIKGPMTTAIKHAKGQFGTRILSRGKGFTLIELIMTVAILSFGIVGIYEALFVSIDTYGYYTRYLGTQDWVNERIWDIQAEFMSVKELEVGQTSGQVVRGHKTFDWTMVVKQLDLEQRLYQVDLTLSWLEGDRKVRTVRTAYLIPSELREYNEDGSV